MRLTTKGRFAVTAMLDLALHGGDGPVALAGISERQKISLSYLEQLFGKLRRRELVESVRGPGGGYHLAREASRVTVADIIRAVEGPLAAVRGEAPEDVVFSGSAESLGRLWIAVRASLRGVLENVTLADLVDGKLPARVDKLADDPEAWVRR